MDFMQLESLEILEEAGIPRRQALAILRVIDMMIAEAKRNPKPESNKSAITDAAE